MGGQVAGLSAVDAVVAQDSVGGAIQVAAKLGSPASTHLIDAASVAYTDAMRVALLLAAAVALGAGAIVYFLFPREPAPAMGHGPGSAPAAGDAR